MLSRTTLLALLVVAYGAVACAPPALDADHASGSSADSTGKSKSKSKKTSKSADDDDDVTSDDDDDSAPVAKPQKQTTSSSSSGGAAAPASDNPAPPASFAAVYSGLKTSCASCHLSGAAGAPTFFGDSEATTHDKFLNQAFNASPSGLVTKGAHSGPAVTADQQSAIEAWVADEPAQ